MNYLCFMLIFFILQAENLLLDENLNVKIAGRSDIVNFSIKCKYFAASYFIFVNPSDTSSKLTKHG